MISCLIDVAGKHLHHIGCCLAFLKLVALLWLHISCWYSGACCSLFGIAFSVPLWTLTLLLRWILASLNGKPTLLVYLQKSGLCESCSSQHYLAMCTVMHDICVVNLRHADTKGKGLCTHSSCVRQSKLKFESFVCLATCHSLSEVTFQQDSFHDILMWTCRMSQTGQLSHVICYIHFCVTAET